MYNFSFFPLQFTHPPPTKKKKKKRKKRALLIHRLFSGGKSPEAKRGKRENFRKLE